MNVQNNPAGRLYALLGAGKKQKGNQPARIVWSAIFEIDSSDTATLLRMLSDLLNLVHETKSTIQRLDDVDQQLHLRALEKVQTVLSQVNFDAPWDQWKNQIDEATLLGLQFSADKLSRLSGSTAIETDSLTDLRRKIDELFNEVTDSCIEPDLKFALLQNLTSLRLSIAAFKIRGVEGLQNAVDRSIGSMILRRDEIKTSSPETGERWKAFFEIVDRLNKLISLSKSAKELSAPTILALSQLF